MCRLPCASSEEETAVQGMNDRAIGIGRCYGVEMNVGKN
jgi:hypothetical protein